MGLFLSRGTRTAGCTAESLTMEAVFGTKNLHHHAARQNSQKLAVILLLDAAYLHIDVVHAMDGAGTGVVVAEIGHAAILAHLIEEGTLLGLHLTEKRQELIYLGRREICFLDNESLHIRLKSSGVEIVLCGSRHDSEQQSDGHYQYSFHAIPYYMGFPLTILTIVFIDNAMNLIDGIDGLSASLSIIALAGFAYCFIHNGLIVYAILIAGLIGILVTYLYFNIWGDPNKNRKIFMGDSGSLTLGFILGFLFVKALRNDPRVMPFSPERIVLAYSFLIVPTFDVVRVIIHRLRAHKPIFDADKSHIHHKMMAAGLNQHQALVGILCLELLFVCINLVSFDYLNCNITYMFIIDVVIYTIFHIVLTKRIQQCTIASGEITNEK